MRANFSKKSVLFSVHDISCFAPSGLFGGLFWNVFLCLAPGFPFFLHSAGIYRVLDTLPDEPSVWVAVAMKYSPALWCLLSLR